MAAAQATVDAKAVKNYSMQNQKSQVLWVSEIPEFSQKSAQFSGILRCGVTFVTFAYGLREYAKPTTIPYSREPSFLAFVANELCAPRFLSGGIQCLDSLQRFCGNPTHFWVAIFCCEDIEREGGFSEWLKRRFDSFFGKYADNHAPPLRDCLAR